MEPRDYKPRSYQWAEPKWSYQPQVKAELARMLNLKMWLRICFVSLLLAGLMNYAARQAFPDLEFDWFTAFTGSIVVLLFILGMMFAILWFIPPVVRINDKAIRRQHGQSARTVMRSDIRSITIDLANPSQPWLHIETGKRPFVCGIANNIFPTETVQWLKELFPEILITERR